MMPSKARISAHESLPKCHAHGESLREAVLFLAPKFYINHVVQARCFTFNIASLQQLHEEGMILIFKMRLEAGPR